MKLETSKVGKRGAVVIPARLRQRFGFREGDTVIAEEAEGGVLIRPAAVLPIEVYTRERKAEFLLNTAVDAEDYREAVAEVRKLGLDPKRIAHHRTRKA